MYGEISVDYFDMNVIGTILTFHLCRNSHNAQELLTGLLLAQSRTKPRDEVQQLGRIAMASRILDLVEMGKRNDEKKH